MAKDRAERLAVAELVAGTVAAVQETGRTWTATVWEGGSQIRVYLRRSGAEMGYLSVDGDGDVVGTAKTARGIHVVDRALTAAGIETYA